MLRVGVTRFDRERKGERKGDNHTNKRTRQTRKEREAQSGKEMQGERTPESERQGVIGRGEGVATWRPKLVNGKRSHCGREASELESAIYFCYRGFEAIASI